MCSLKHIYFIADSVAVIKFGFLKYYLILLLAKDYLAIQGSSVDQKEDQ